MSRGTLLTFEEGCNKYLENCRQRNLREGTINHYIICYMKYKPVCIDKFIINRDMYELDINLYKKN